MKDRASFDQMRTSTFKVAKWKKTQLCEEQKINYGVSMHWNQIGLTRVSPEKRGTGRPSPPTSAAVGSLQKLAMLTPNSKAAIIAAQRAQINRQTAAASPARETAHSRNIWSAGERVEPDPSLFRTGIRAELPSRTFSSPESTAGSLHSESAALCSFLSLNMFFLSWGYTTDAFYDAAPEWPPPFFVHHGCTLKSNYCVAHELLVRF